MDQNLQVKLINKVNNMVKEKFSMQMVIFSKANLLMVNVSMHKSHITIKIIIKDK